MACACPSVPFLSQTPQDNKPVPFNPTVNPTATWNPESSVLPLHGDTFSLVRLHPEDGTLSVQLRREAQQAKSLGQHMFVEFDASW